VRQTARLAGAAVSGAPSDRPRKTVTDSAAQGRACSQGRLSSWFVRLCVKSRRFVTSGRVGAEEGAESHKGMGGRGQHRCSRRRLHSHLVQLCHLVPELWSTCGQAEAALQSVLRS
jgi:hypothetical protein